MSKQQCPLFLIYRSLSVCQAVLVKEITYGKWTSIALFPVLKCFTTLVTFTHSYTQMTQVAMQGANLWGSVSCSRILQHDYFHFSTDRAWSGHDCLFQKVTKIVRWSPHDSNTRKRGSDWFGAHWNPYIGFSDKISQCYFSATMLV